MLQYTVFEQLKNFLISRRTARLRLGGRTAAAATLTDWDFFILGALSKLGKSIICVIGLFLIVLTVATSTTYPYM